MNVLVIPSWYPSESRPTSGIFIAQQVRALSRMGVSVAVLFVAVGSAEDNVSVTVEDDVLTSRVTMNVPQPQETFLRQKIAGLKYRSTVFFKRLFAVWRGYRALESSGFRPDVIHVHALWPAGVIGAWLALRYRVKVVITEHSEEYIPGSALPLLKRRYMLPFVLRPLASRATIYIAVSEYLKQALGRLRIHGDIRVVPNVVPKNPVRPRRTCGGIPSIVHVSHLTPVKNLPLLFEALVLVCSIRSDFQVEIVGDGGLGIEALATLVEQLGITDVVIFRGLLSPSEVAEVISDSAFGVITSESETFSVFAAELLMCGRPVVTTDCGGPAGFVSLEVGRVVENHNPRALADGILWMLDNFESFNPDRLHEYAVELFSEEAVVPQLLEIYRETLGVTARAEGDA